MFARLLKIKTETEKIKDAAKLFEESVIPLCKEKKGYKGAFFLGNHQTGENLPITLWETEEDMLDTEKSRFFQEQVFKFINLFEGPPIREVYEVIVEDIKE